jgi:serine/threonine protein kinase
MKTEVHTALQVQSIIDPKNEFTIPLLAQCTVKSFRKSDEFERCVTPTQNSNTNPQQYQQLIYPYAGKTVFHIITKKYKSQSTLTKNFFKIFSQLYSVIKGLKALNDHHYIHADIKLDNLMMNKGKLYLIDFGIAQSESNIFNLKTGNYLLSADQVYYPPEFKAFTKKHKSFEGFHNFYLETWKNDEWLFNVLKDIHRDTYDTDIKNVFKMTKRDILQQAHKTDTFSLGIELLELVLICRINTRSFATKNNAKFINMYFDLIRGMTRLDPMKRLSAEQVYQEYMSIISYMQTYKKN